MESPQSYVLTMFPKIYYLYCYKIESILLISWIIMEIYSLTFLNIFIYVRNMQFLWCIVTGTYLYCYTIKSILLMKCAISFILIETLYYKIKSILLIFWITMEMFSQTFLNVIWHLFYVWNAQFLLLLLKLHLRFDTWVLGLSIWQSGTNFVRLARN